jgi:hypothetical protein
MKGIVSSTLVRNVNGFEESIENLGKTQIWENYPIATYYSLDLIHEGVIQRFHNSEDILEEKGKEKQLRIIYFDFQPLPLEITIDDFLVDYGLEKWKKVTTFKVGDLTYGLVKDKVQVVKIVKIVEAIKTVPIFDLTLLKDRGYFCNNIYKMHFE